MRCRSNYSWPPSRIWHSYDSIKSVNGVHRVADVILKTHNGCIETGSRKIRFDKKNDIIFLHTTSPCCDRSLPGLRSRPETLPDHGKIFANVRYLALGTSAITKIQNDQLHSSAARTHVFESGLSLVSEFRSLRTLYVVLNDQHFKLIGTNLASDIILRTWEETCAPHICSFSSFIQKQQHFDGVLQTIRNAMNSYKVRQNLDDWTIPDFEAVAFNRIVSLGGDRWGRSIQWYP
jgi:hypothetical protein